MDEKIRAINSELTQMYKWEDDLYHRYGIFFGLSDPAVWVLYGLYEDTEQVFTQNDLVCSCAESTSTFDTWRYCRLAPTSSPN